MDEWIDGSKDLIAPQNVPLIGDTCMLQLAREWIIVAAPYIKL